MLMNNLMLLLSMAIPMGIAIVVLLVGRAWRQRDKRRSPLNNKLLNLPGESLRKQIARHGDACTEATTLLISIGPLMFSAWLLTRMRGFDWSQVHFGIGDAILAFVGSALIAWCVWRVFRHTARMRRCREGLEAELAVAQSLTLLMAEGAQLVFHDFPGDGFNIDHIVIGRSAVFAVETKSRKKPAEGGKSAARLQYDGTGLTHPGGIREMAPIEQAHRQAVWLAKFLGSGVGEAVRVVPVVALPGWYIESPTGLRPDVWVTNGKNSVFMLGNTFGTSLTDTMRKRIAHVLGERYPSLDEVLASRA